MSRLTSASDWLLRSPIVWGVLAWLLFDAVVRSVGGAWLSSYFTETWIHSTTTAVFFVGMAALAVRGLGVLGQWGVLRRPLLDPPRAGGQPVTDAELLVEQLDRQPSWLQKTYPVRRLRNALEHVVKTHSADGLERQLETLEQNDYERMNADYAFVLVIIGVVPLLGFLGTVIGISNAIGDLSIDPSQLEGSLSGVIAGLKGAFSTTALALSLSIVLLFAKLLVWRAEDSLLVETGHRAAAECIGRFETIGSATDPNVTAISRMCDQVVRATELMASRQSELWRETIDDTHRHWSNATRAAGEQLTDTVAEGLRVALMDHATCLTGGVEQQLAALNSNLEGQARSLAAAVEQQTGVVTTTVAEQLALVAQTITTQAGGAADRLAQQTEAACSVLISQIDATTATAAQQANTLAEAAAAHTTQLDSGAKELLGNLRTGLERMAELLVEALQKHGETLTQAEEELASENRRHLSEVEAALGESMVVAADRQEKLIARSEELMRDMHDSVSDSASATIAHQQQLVKQGEVLLSVVEATGQVGALQQTLNSNLDALARGHNLEETLMSLSAAIQLLSARVGKQPETATTVHATENRTSKAA